MKLSYQWLNSLLPEPLSITDISNILTSIGLEVEEVVSSSAIKGGLQGLVIGKVLTCGQHPNADKLRLTTVDVGGDTPLQIVCGAPNVAAGQTVVVATVGCVVHPLQGEAFEIKKAKIRGEHSEGMICAEDEIGLGEGHDGIIVLPQDIAAGTLAASYYNIPDADFTIEVGLTPNRMDAMSHMGVAKDVCAYLSNRDNKPYVQVLANAQIPNATGSNTISINIADTKLCRRYIGAELSNVTIAPSPQWLTDRLATIGIRSINNVVDITNYVLHETGQPLHAFDLQTITGNEIVVKTANAGETFTCLDGTEKKLLEQDLMICNGSSPMCIAGVFGGHASGVTDNTKSLFLESAWFDGPSIRKTSMHHGLRTEAAIRFEKGVDISQTRYALDRAIALLVDICGATLAAPVTDLYPNAITSTEIRVSYEYINRLSGANYSKEKVKNILLHLCFGILQEDADGIVLQVPFAKPDITLPADIVEEIMRIDGLDQVPFTGKISFGLTTSGVNASRKMQEGIAHCLNNLGFHELFTNSISNSTYYPQENKLVRMMNSLSTELDCMRPSMLESGLQVIAYNLNRKNTDLFLYEIGKIYFNVNGKYVEQQQLHLYLSGNTRKESWQGGVAKASIYDCKATIDAIAARTGLQFTYSYADNEITLKQRKQTIGKITLVSATTLKQFDIKQEVWHAYLDWNALVQAGASGTKRFTPVSKFQGVRRDLALVLDQAVSFEQVRKSIEDTQCNLLNASNVFDVFVSEKLGVNKKSYAVSFDFAHPDRTLTDVEIDAEMQKLQTSIISGTGATIRS
jgi:phenylalanyl-tRNA synthetase beta chain